MLGIGEDGASQEQSRNETQEGGMDLSALSGLLGGMQQNDKETSEQGNAGLNLGGIDVGMIMKLQQVMSAFHNEDDNTRFLQALRPLMREERRHKVDEVLRLMKLFSMIPLLKESGILDSFFGN